MICETWDFFFKKKNLLIPNLYRLMFNFCSLLFFISLICMFYFSLSLISLRPKLFFRFVLQICRISLIINSCIYFLFFHWFIILFYFQLLLSPSSVFFCFFFFFNKILLRSRDLWFTERSSRGSLALFTQNNRNKICNFFEVACPIFMLLP